MLQDQRRASRVEMLLNERKHGHILFQGIPRLSSTISSRECSMDRDGLSAFKSMWKASRNCEDPITSLMCIAIWDTLVFGGH